MSKDQRPPSFPDEDEKPVKKIDKDKVKAKLESLEDEAKKKVYGSTDEEK